MTAPAERIPTSQLFLANLAEVYSGPLTLTKLSAGFRERSFGMVLLFLGLAAMLPGIGILAGVVLLIIGFQMMMAYQAPFLPTLIGQRTLPAAKVARLMTRVVPVMRALEKVIRPRWRMPFVATKRLVGLLVSLLAVTLFMPIPLSNVIPSALTMLLAFAYLEEDGALLCVTLIASFVSLAVTATEIWGAFHGARYLFR